MRDHWVTMGALDLLIIALVAMIAVGTGEGTPFLEEETALKIPTQCPAEDSKHTTIHLKHEVMCSLFYKCQAGEKIVMPCAKENKKTDDLQFFNPELQVCDWRRNVSCTNPRCSLNTDSSGRFIKIPYGWNCRDYYDCEDGRLVMRECPEEEKFDYNERQCVRHANCEPIKDCNSIYKEAFEENRNFYSICLATRKTVLPCPEGKYFSISRQDCDNDSGPDRVRCKGKGTAPHPSDCRLYKKCIGGFEEIVQCPRGLHYNAFSQECQDPIDAGCDNSLPCSQFFPFYIGTIRCTGNNKAPNKCDCSSYIECVNGMKVPKKCSTGLHFNSYAQECQDPCDAGCDKNWPCETPTPTPKPPECTGNGKRPNKHDCNKYEQCVNGKIVSKMCPPGLHFNPYEQDCQDPCDAGCDKNWPCEPPTPTPKPPECTGNGKRPNKHDCNKYEQCVNGKIVSKMCPPGLHFNPYEQDCQDPCDAGCDKNWPCEPPTPTPKPPECTGNGKRPNKHDCNKYEQCVNGKIVSKMCPPGLHFNPYEQDCQDPCDAGCDKNWPCEPPTPTPKPPECTGNGKRPNKHDCNKYEQCVNGKIVSKMCPPGLHFNPYEQDCQNPCNAGCDKNWPCEPTPECNGEGGMRPDPHDCRLYAKCVGGYIRIIMCPYGKHFNPFAHVCQDPSIAGCDQSSCEPPCAPACKGSGKSPDKCDCTSYRQCQNGEIVTNKCPNGWHFNPFELECQPVCEARCDKSDPCPTPTPEPEPECTGDYKVGNPRDCHVYQVCQNGNIREVRCPGEDHFNPYAQKCQTPCEARCDKTYPCPTKPTEPEVDCSGNRKSPDPDNCRMYQVCIKGEIDRLICPSDEYFNPYTGTCQHEDGAGCDERVCIPECIEGTKRVHTCDCRLYYECINGGDRLRDCGKGLHFNPITKQCEHPRDAGCTLPYPTVYDDCVGSEKVPHELNCGSYYECKDNIKVPKDCPVGLQFSTHAQICVEPEDARADCESLLS